MKGAAGASRVSPPLGAAPPGSSFGWFFSLGTHVRARGGGVRPQGATRAGLRLLGFAPSACSNFDSNQPYFGSISVN